MTTHRRQLLQQNLARELELWAAKPIETLRRELQNPVSYGVESENLRFQVEVQLLENEDDYVHVSVAVDDMSFSGTVNPVADSFVVASK